MNTGLPLGSSEPQLYEVESELYHLLDTYGFYQNYVSEVDALHKERAENILVACHIVGSTRMDCKGENMKPFNYYLNY